MTSDGSRPSQNPPIPRNAELPLVGGVYWCLAPYKPRDIRAPISPGPVPHPVLILKVYDQLSPVEVLIVPGTGTLGGPYAHLDFEVAGGSIEAKEMGLTKSTRFKLSSIDRIPFSSNLFVPKVADMLGVEFSKIGQAPQSVISRAVNGYGELLKLVARQRAKSF